MTPALVRLAHFSDIHVSASPLGWRGRDWLTKRATGWLNLKFGRGTRFGHAESIVRAMRNDIRDRRCDHQIFSGDATTMGFASEFTAAVQALGVDDSDAIPGLAVPGNHDYYIRSAANSGLFERSFAKWQQGRRVHSDCYPFAQQVGHCWLIGVNSSQSNFLVWDARGHMGEPQAERLRELLRGLSPGPKILVTHYPLYLANGEPEHRWRLLRDWQTLRQIAIEHGISLWLHGHRHTGYTLPASAEHPFPIICAGSATQEGRWSWNEYVIESNQLRMTRRKWHPAQASFVEDGTMQLELPV